MDEARAAQTRASIAQSHAIHAAVVEHEAKTVKRRATLALAHDVKTWNVNRKRELLQSCIAFARSQHEATRRSVDAWSGLRDGFIGTPVNPSIIERRPAPQTQASFGPPSVLMRSEPTVEPGEVGTTVYESNSSSSNSDSQPSIVAVDHSVLSAPLNDDHVTGDSRVAVSSNPPMKPNETEPESVLPFAQAAPIPEEEPEDLMSFPKREGPESSEHETTQEPSFNDEKLSASMQSLVDGLMNWGGGLDAEEDHFALPAGMATSIVLEENNALSLGKS